MAAELRRLESQLEQLRDSYAALGKAYAEALHAQDAAERRCTELEARLRALATRYGAFEARAKAHSTTDTGSVYAGVAAELLACLDDVNDVPDVPDEAL